MCPEFCLIRFPFFELACSENLRFFSKQITINLFVFIPVLLHVPSIPLGCFHFFAPSPDFIVDGNCKVFQFKVVGLFVSGSLLSEYGLVWCCLA
jgi:hypothetical protein